MSTTNQPPEPIQPLDCAGYRKLLASVERDEQQYPGQSAHDYRGKLAWVLARARHYAEKTGLTPESILDAWEERRTYWYMNYYQECNQPEIKGDTVRVFDTVAELLASIGSTGFRCPACEGVSKSPYECTTGLPMKGKGKQQTCNWKVYGLFGHLGKGVSVYVKEKLAGESLFMPVAWEEKPATPPAPAPTSAP